MPSPWHKAPISGGGGGGDVAGGSLGRLLASLRPGRAGPLPVQTGFPTSLADIVVKNHGRLKKPSKSKKRRQHPDPVTSASPSPPPVAVQSPSSGEKTIPPAAADATVQEKPNLVPVCGNLDHKGAAFRLGLEFLVISNVLILGLLVIWSKKLVVAITSAAFALFLLDSAKICALRWLKPCPAARRRLDSAIPRLDLGGRGRVSPIREIGAEMPRLDSVPLESSADSIGSESVFDESASSDQGSDFSIERSGDISPSNLKQKKNWRKLFTKKLRKNRKCKDEKRSSLGSCCESEQEKEEVKRGEENASDFSNVNLIRSCPSNEMLELIKEEGKEMESSREEVTKEGALLFLVFVAVVLLGLIGGKLAAVVLAMICCVFLNSAEVVLRNGNMDAV